MSSPPPALPRLRRVFGSLSRSPTVLWSAFVLTHLWLGYLDLVAPGGPMGDVVNQYRFWTEQADLGSFYVGIDKAWVYPIVALLPMILAGTFGFANYASTWLSLVFVLDAVAFAVLVGWRRPSRPVALGWWWIAFLLLLGPIALGHIDSISVPVALVAVLMLAARPRLAAFLLTIATWIKVWPAALIAAAIVASRARVRILVTAVLTSLVIVGFALALGSGTNVWSFIFQQTSRALQVESPASTVWMWLSYLHIGGSFPYYNEDLNTFEVKGPGSTAVAALMNPLLVLAVIVIAVMGIVAVQRGAVVTELLAPLSLALVTAFMVFNKVGSPQYMSWLAVPVLLGLATRSTGHGPSFRFPAAMALAVAALTQVFYPYFYAQLLELQLPLLLALTLRNILLLIVFGWSVSVLGGLLRPFVIHESLDDKDAWLPSAWPFTDRPAQRGTPDDPTALRTAPPQ